MADEVPTEVALEQSRPFRWGEVPAGRGLPGAQAARAAVPEEEDPVPPGPDLGPLTGFTGVFHGTGLNTIFRPQDFAVTPTDLPTPGTGPDDNILEINLTEETLVFNDPLGSIPNRGMVQKDEFLNGVPYLQKVKDITDPGAPVGIHFEPGVWLSVPPTDQPQLDRTVSRMASIPHGTTINAQGTFFTVPGGPFIAPVDITPFPLGHPETRPFKFPSQTAAKTDSFRIPQDLTDFIAAGTITQDILDNPNLVIDRRAKAQNITSTDVIIISTNPSLPLFGGGTDNIALLLGDPTSTNPNADAIEMTAIFWIETVSLEITVPPCSPARPATVEGDISTLYAPVPSFTVFPTRVTTEDHTITVSYTQIQYTQTVVLNFNNLSWPHVSVATLVPKEAVSVVFTPPSTPAPPPAGPPPVDTPAPPDAPARE